MKKLKFFWSPKFLLNLLGVGIAWLVIVVGFNMYVKSYTNHGVEIDVPNFKGVHKNDLDSFLEGQELNYVVFDSAAILGLPKGTVYGQDPLPTDSTGVKVKPGRKILLYVVRESVNEKIPCMTNNPAYEIAQIQLEQKGFKVKLKAQRDTSRTAVVGNGGYLLGLKHKGKLLDCESEVPKGATIELIYAKPPTDEVYMLPNFVGMTVEQAQERASRLGIILDVQEVSDGEPSELKVTRQIPEFDSLSTVKLGNSVMIIADK